MIPSSLGQQPGGGSPGWLALVAQTSAAWGYVWLSSFVLWWLLWPLLIHEDMRFLFWQCCLPSESPVSSIMWYLSFPSCWKLNYHQEGFSLADTSSLKPWLAPWSFPWCTLSPPSSSTATLPPLLSPQFMSHPSTVSRAFCDYGWYRGKQQGHSHLSTWGISTSQLSMENGA